VLATRPDIQQALRADPSLVKEFVEEVLRFQPSVQAIVRKAHEDIELAGVSIPAGSHVILCTGSANRDSEFWDKPDEFRLDRKNSGRQHFTFGYGRHLCIGMHLARRELAVAIRILLERLDDICSRTPRRRRNICRYRFFAHCRSCRSDLPRRTLAQGA
jgi:cytochrome P450 family 144